MVSLCFVQMAMVLGFFQKQHRKQVNDNGFDTLYMIKTSEVGVWIYMRWTKNCLCIAFDYPMYYDWLIFRSVVFVVMKEVRDDGKKDVVISVENLGDLNVECVHFSLQQNGDVCMKVL